MIQEDPRGERNNNPGNLEDFGIAWEGLAGKDGPYCVFDTAEHGLRALGRDLHTKATRDGLKTLRRLIDVYAPPSENDAKAYLADVCRWTAWGPDDPLDIDPPSHLQLLMTAVVRQECGRCIYDEATMAGAAVDALTANAVSHPKKEDDS